MNMTESEVIEILNDITFQDCGRYPYGTMPKVRDIAINALEKQIPNKPHKNFEKFSGVWCSCGKYLGKGYFVDKPIYCSDCGQKLDWESDEE